MSTYECRQVGAEKTHFILLGSSQMLAKKDTDPLRVGGVDAQTLDAVRDHGVVIDAEQTR